jgi:hypothetical protein
MSIADEFERLYKAYGDGWRYSSVHLERLGFFAAKHGDKIIKLLRLGEENE